MRFTVPIRLIGAAAVAIVCIQAAAATPPAIVAKQAQAERILAQISALDERLNTVSEAYDGARVRLKALRVRLRGERVALTKARRQYRVAEDRAAKLLVYLYTSNRGSSLEVILGASSLSDMLRLTVAENALSTQAAELATAAKRARAVLRARVDALDASQAAAQATVKELAARRVEMERGLIERSRLLIHVEAQLARLEAEERARQARLAAEARARLARLASARAKAEAQAEARAQAAAERRTQVAAAQARSQEAAAAAAAAKQAAKQRTETTPVSNGARSGTTGAAAATGTTATTTTPAATTAATTTTPAPAAGAGAAGAAADTQASAYPSPSAQAPDVGTTSAAPAGGGSTTPSTQGLPAGPTGSSSATPPTPGATPTTIAPPVSTSPAPTTNLPAVTVPALPAVPPIPTGPLPTGYPEAATIAMRYLGVPYVWGGESPKGFDCSGLVSYVYAQLGVPLPHFAAAQFTYGVPVPEWELAPGDLVFFDKLNHVGIYIGGGEFIDAPHTGAFVEIDSLYAPWFAAHFVGGKRL